MVKFISVRLQIFLEFRFVIRFLVLQKLKSLVFVEVKSAVVVHRQILKAESCRNFFAYSPGNIDLLAADVAYLLLHTAREKYSTNTAMMSTQLTEFVILCLA